ncbi:MAG: hypothetical protein IPL61_40240 [Myxococcales bacterium]|nr:hypothetical protein [Myxococcales bacterium]
MPLLRLLLVVLALVNLGGLASAVEASCDGACADEPCDDGACPPLCASCACARLPIAASTAPATAVAPPPIDLRTLTFPTESEPSAPEPQEILRVPITRAG